MTRRNTLIVPLAALMFAGLWFASPKASAQSQTILAEVYGRGVHAYYAGQFNDAYQHLSSAINGGTRDPRAYYFRGIVAYQQGRSYEAESDWNQGAMIEARAGGASGVGRALSRFQGSGRLKLEEIRQQARFQAMSSAVERSDVRRNELGLNTPAPPSTAPATPGPSAPAPAAPAAPVADNPFGGAAPSMTAGEPELESDNAMAGLDENPFKDDVPATGAASDGAAAGGGDDPFGSAAPAAGDDPFGSAAPAAGDDPFGAPAGSPAPAGGDPFGAPAESAAPSSDDPFGDPFGN